MKLFICKVCGHIEFDNLLETCPVCGSPKEQFTQNDDVFKQSKAKSPEAETKHVPAVTVNKMCKLATPQSCVDINVKIGEVIHPMEEKHYIHFVDAYQDGKFIARTEFAPLKVYPATSFHLKDASGKVTIVENCTVHGYWMTDVNL